MKPFRVVLTSAIAVLFTLALSGCSDDPNYVSDCAKKVAKKIGDPKISITKEKWTKTGTGVTVAISITAIVPDEEKKDEEKATYFKASCIFKNDSIVRSFIRPVKTG